MYYDIIIIGGGPSGMMATYSILKENKNLKVGLLEKNNKLGNKLLLTGGGRCNITNTMPIKEQLNLYKEKNFLKPSYYKLTNQNLLKIFEKEKIEFKTEENGRIFPKTNKSETIKNILEKLIKDADIHLNTKVLNIKKENKNFKIETKEQTFTSKKLILTCGGISYKKTGSNGDGYKLAKNLNHTITNIKPGLASLRINNPNLNKLSGLKLENIKVYFKDKKKIEETGELLITHKGLSGPAIINLSNKLLENTNYNLLNNNTNFEKRKISLDLTPNKINEEIKKDIENNIKDKGKIKIKTYLKTYMPYKFIEYFNLYSKLELDKKLSEINKKEKNRLIETLKKIDFEVDDIILEDSKVTIGGVNIKEINNKTLESKIVPNLYFAGEILEPAGPTGGFNLQLAFSTGYNAGYNASKSS